MSRSSIHIKPFLSGLLLILLTQVSSLARADIHISGSSTVLPIMLSVADSFFIQTGIVVSVTGGGSGIGIKDALSGKSHIGMVSRDLHTEELRKLQAHTIAFDGVAVITHISNPKNEISPVDIKNIFGGHFNQWSSLTDYPNHELINVIVKKKGRSTREVFDTYFNIKNVTPSAREIGSNAEVLVLVGIDPESIGYASIGAIERAIALGLRIKALPVQGISASSHNVANKTYPIRRALNLVTRPLKTTKRKRDETERFIRFVLSPQGQDIVQNKNYIPVNKK